MAILFCCAALVQVAACVLVSLALGACGAASSSGAGAPSDAGADAAYRDAGVDAASRDARASDAGEGGVSVLEAGGPDAAVNEPHRELCDGSKGIRFYWQMLPNASRHNPGADVLDYNGYVYLIVTGTCEYWTYLGDINVTTHGTLSAEQAAQLAADVHYDAWPRLAGVHGPSEFQGYDIGSESVTDGSATVICAACSDAVAPEIRAIFDGAWLWQKTLRTQGAALTGPLRVSVVDVGQAPWDMYYHPIGWPLATPLATLRYVFDNGGDRPKTNWGVLLSDAGDVATLRELRSRYLKQEQDRWGYGGGIPVNAPSVESDAIRPEFGYTLMFRDVMPLEDEQGVIALDATLP
jgi:hypothetical protein